MEIEGFVEIDGARLRWIRERRALTSKELAAKSGVPYGTIRRLERGGGRRMAKLQTVRKLAGALEVELWELMTKR